ncbi:MAG TPA: metallophosphoesterase, partial [Solirubrobacterales bacterium]|nr:metallophosphoesterase [Solirubrobacterales bacterium]
MRTAIISDLHLGVASDEDVLRDPAVRRILLEEIAGADRLVLLGDAIELRTLPLGLSLDRARPFFEELGATLGNAEVILVPGNHDHRLAEPLLDELSVAGTELGLEHLHSPAPGPTAMIDGWLGPARLRIAYPGVWLRPDLYATHGHYMDAHLRLPRAECVATATMLRLSRPVPLNAVPRDYERVLRPIYGFSYGLAQALRLPRRRRGNRFERWWEILSGEATDLSLRARVGKASFPVGVAGLNRLLHAEFEPDVSVAAISRSGVAAGVELATRLGLGAVSVITGHTHRAGPLEGEGDWTLPGGGHLYNTGSW